MPTESQKLILLEDISRIVVSSHDLHETLDHITALLADRMGVQVCSLYLVENGSLVLRSTRGLKPSAVGKVTMAPGEGLTGLTFDRAEPVSVERAEDHPRYKFFEGIGEEAFHSYLGVPLIHRKKPIGVLAVQTVAPRAFTSDDIRLLVTAASQVSTVIANARLLDRQAQEKDAGAVAPPVETFLRGIGVSPGVAAGMAHPIDEDLGLETYPSPAARDVDTELAQLESALVRSVEDVEGLREQVTRALTDEDGAIFHAHLLILEDRGLQDKVRERIRAGDSAAQAVWGVARDYIDAFRKLDDPYLRERAADVRDVAQRLLQHLREEGPAPETLEFDQPTIVVADDLTPSQFVRLIQPQLVGVALARGGRNSHTAILSRSAGIPAVVGLESDLPPVKPGQPMILDGNAGLVYFSPPEAVVREYERLAEDGSRLSVELLSHVGEPCVSRDGLPLRLLGNAALLSDIPKILAGGGQGVGLYRTEFPFLIRATFPDEDEQVQIYEKILQSLEGRVATLRTLDVGGDKTLPYLPLPKEDNPHLGWRSIRVSLEMEEPFRIQVRALLRASLLGPVRIVFPMISTVEELRRARDILEEERATLSRRGIEVPPVPVGAMVEVPSAALALDRLAPFADFFSIGTNDLVQYLLAVDRANRRVAHLYDPLNPTVLEVIHRISESGNRLDRPISVCGEMASRSLGAAALLAVGIEEFSVSPGALPRILRLLQTADVSRLKELSSQLRAATTAADVRQALRQELSDQAVPPALWRGE